jgi:hypothetical protein
MAHLFGNTSGDLLTTDDGSTLLTDDLPSPTVPTVTAFPLMLLLRLRLHATWLLFMLIPSF